MFVVLFVFAHACLTAGAVFGVLLLELQVRVCGGALQSRLLVMLVCIRAIMFCVSCLFMLSEFRGKQA